jgi:hypothetical protein
VIRLRWGRCKDVRRGRYTEATVHRRELARRPLLLFAFKLSYKSRRVDRGTTLKRSVRVETLLAQP